MALTPESDAMTETSVPAEGRLRAGWAGMSGGRSTAFGATVLLMVSSVLSGGLGLLRTIYIASVFGAGHQTDAYFAAFTIPDMISYFLVGGVASISLITILNRYREAGDEAGADRALSVVLNAMLVVLGAAVVVTEFLTPWLVRFFFKKFDAETSALCIHLTRLLLPGPLFFFAGGVLGSRLLVRKIFVYQAMTPIVYNLGIILGGVFLSKRLGVDSLAWGAMAGAFVGTTLINAVGAVRGGFRYRPILNLWDPAFKEWLILSLPLMIGFSLTMADKWILNYFAAGDRGGITLLSNAKALFNSPLSIIGMAAGAASLPFFSRLYAQGRMFDFNGAVSRAVSRLLAVSLLVSGLMVGLAEPIVDILRRGSFTHKDAAATATYFAVFAVTLCLWSAQGIYARAFYAAGDTLTPAVTGTVITVAVIPVYWVLYRGFGVSGLAWASDLGIFILTVTMALQLHRKRLVSIASLEGGELVRAGVASLVGYMAVVGCVRFVPHGAGHAGDVVVIGVGTVVWGVVCLGVLVGLGSKLPGQLRRRG